MEELSIESDEMKLSEEVDGQVTREWKSCESDQGGSSAIGSLTDDLGYFCLPIWKGNQYEKEEEERRTWSDKLVSRDPPLPEHVANS
ncbi:unnamed protein product [Prunus armeniaca]